MVAGGSFIGLHLRERTPELARDRSLFAIYLDDEIVPDCETHKSGGVAVELLCQKQMRHPGLPSNNGGCAGSPPINKPGARAKLAGNGRTHSKGVS
jgi:hypothetical protein